MALKATIFKAELHIADMTRNYYQTHTITLARHPSETDERMMMRILAFILNASESLTFAGGLSASDEPDLWDKDLSGAISLWIMVGLPDEKQIKKALSRSSRVAVYCYGQATPQWWAAIKEAKLERLSIVSVPATQSRALANLAQRTMNIQCTIQDEMLWLSCGELTIELNLVWLKNT